MTTKVKKINCFFVFFLFFWLVVFVLGTEKKNKNSKKKSLNLDNVASTQLEEDLHKPLDDVLKEVVKKFRNYFFFVYFFFRVFSCRRFSRFVFLCFFSISFLFGLFDNAQLSAVCWRTKKLGFV